MELSPLMKSMLETLSSSIVQSALYTLKSSTHVLWTIQQYLAHPARQTRSSSEQAIRSTSTFQRPMLQRRSLPLEDIACVHLVLSALPLLVEQTRSS